MRCQESRCGIRSLANPRNLWEFTTVGYTYLEVVQRDNEVSKGTA